MLNLKEIRKQHGITGATLCKQAELSPAGLSMIENGRRRPSVDLAKRLGAALDIDWTLFFDDENANDEKPPTAAGA